MTDDLQTLFDSACAAVGSRSLRSLAEEVPGVDRALAAAVERWLRALSAELAAVDETHAYHHRVAAAPWLVDLAALAAESGDDDGARRWLARAAALAAGTRAAERVAAVAAMPPWFVEARRLQWRYQHEQPEDELDRAEAAFLARWSGDPIAVAAGLGAGS